MTEKTVVRNRIYRFCFFSFIFITLISGAIYLKFSTKEDDKVTKEKYIKEEIELMLDVSYLSKYEYINEEINNGNLIINHDKAIEKIAAGYIDEYVLNDYYLTIEKLEKEEENLRTVAGSYGRDSNYYYFQLEQTQNIVDDFLFIILQIKEYNLEYFNENYK